MNTLTLASREVFTAHEQLKELEKSYKLRKTALTSLLNKNQTILNNAEVGLDYEKILQAEQIIHVTDPAQGGDDWKTCIADAIKQLATGTSEHQYKDLWTRGFGTKNYAHWRGQRSDNEYGYGPKHGSICFRVEIQPAVRKRGQDNLTEEEIEASIYYLANVEKIYAAKTQAA